MNELYDKLKAISLKDAEITEIELPKPMNNQEQEIEKMSKYFDIAHSIMIITNKILEPLNLPISQRQLENDRVDLILKYFIRETRVDAVGEVYTFVVNHFTNEQEKFEFFKWWSEKYHPNPINEPLSD